MMLRGKDESAVNGLFLTDVARPRYTLSAHTVREVFLSQKSIQPPNNSDSDAVRAFGVALDPR